MVQEIPEPGQPEAGPPRTACDPPENLEKERALYLAAEISLLKAKIQTSKDFLLFAQKTLKKQQDLHDTWLEELSALKEGQLLLGIKDD